MIPTSWSCQNKEIEGEDAFKLASLVRVEDVGLRPARGVGGAAPVRRRAAQWGVGRARTSIRSPTQAMKAHF